MKALAIAAALLGFTAAPGLAGVVPGSATTELIKGRPEVAERAFSGLQLSFEQGQSTEFDLLDSYKAFYQEDIALAAALEHWIRIFPDSSYAYLARGVYYRKRGEQRRGTQYVNKTPPADMVYMHAMFQKAKLDLAKSLQLNNRSYIAELHLLNIAQYEGDVLAARRALSNATLLLPSNFLARARYTVSLTPRWGGSYTQIEAFISRCRSQGVAEETLALLQAIKLEDQGHTAEELGRTEDAMNFYRRALALSKSGGPRFRRDYLQDSMRFCRHYQFGGRDCS